jgi:hypothetical protein
MINYTHFNAMIILLSLGGILAIGWGISGRAGRAGRRNFNTVPAKVVLNAIKY